MHRAVHPLPPSPLPDPAPCPREKGLCGAESNGRIAAVRRKRNAVFPMTKELRKWYQTIGREGGLKGGIRTALNMTPEERTERARKAAAARWSKRKKTR